MAISNVSNGLRSGVCTSSTRPTTPYEGQMIYETDTKCLMIYDGTSWDYVTGAPPNIVTMTTDVSTAALTSSWEPTSLQATITKKYANSAIWVVANASLAIYNSSTADGWGKARIMETGSSRTMDFYNVLRSYNAASTGRVNMFPCLLQWVDTQTGTGSRTYRLDIGNNSSTSIEFNSYSSGLVKSNLFLWEVFQ